MERTPAERVHVEHSRCPFCKDAVQPEQEKAACAACMAWHHADCWQSHGACAACGVERGLQEPGAPPAERPIRKPTGRGSCAWEGCPWDAHEKLPETKVMVGYRNRPLNLYCRGHAAFALREQGQWTVLLGLAFGLPMISAGALTEVGFPWLPAFVALTLALVIGAGVRALLLSRRLRKGEDPT